MSADRFAECKLILASGGWDRHRLTRSSLTLGSASRTMDLRQYGWMSRPARRVNYSTTPTGRSMSTTALKP